ncbi:putative glycoside hydrolase [Pradoshia sp.]
MKVVKLLVLFNLLAFSAWSVEASAEEKQVRLHSGQNISIEVKQLPADMNRFAGGAYSFTYPDAVRGIYVTGNSAGGSKYQDLVQLIESTELNAMVIDIKDDRGNLTYLPDESKPYAKAGMNLIKNPEKLLKDMEKREIYPIARVVVFKDSYLADMKPEWSFKEGNSVWKNGRGEAFVNPFLKEVWDYNIDIAIEAAKMGFEEIQFDYVRFPEGFETRDDELKYSVGDYGDKAVDNVQHRVNAVTDFVAYAKEQLEPYDVKVSVDIFGYSATLPEAPGIGQNFSKISEHVDVISSMIYPSHWTSYFGIAKPDLEPYKLVKEYAKLENKKLDELKTPPVSRPWIQDFTATWLGSGNYIPYGKKEVEDQIRALNEEGIDEFLLWNAGNRYTPGVDYTP